MNMTMRVPSEYTNLILERAYKYSRDWTSAQKNSSEFPWILKSELLPSSILFARALGKEETAKWSRQGCCWCQGARHNYRCHRRNSKAHLRLCGCWSYMYRNSLVNTFQACRYSIILGFIDHPSLLKPRCFGKYFCFLLQVNMTAKKSYSVEPLVTVWD